ncbi:outer membrane transport energization protein TonB (TC 2.C.1.1.1) [Marinospirillum celere]|uniref:Protein TonB n=1 Tax=Marinospirillum celere TaxID=1122252 RepID=A0A1I1J5A3_9GAMM|nr:TonB family protein [Marinospirillum celere]SFC41123.1 outer membrane transport energization protein TonB (TC 2.C.1.1.1) [Marinospirillum celere]
MTLQWLRNFLAAPLAFGGVLVFFLGLGWTIQAPDGDRGSRPERIALNWAEVPPEPEVERLEPPPPPPPELNEPEAANEMDTSSAEVSALDSDFVLDTPQPDLDMDLGLADFPDLNPNLASIQATPVHREQPQYPRQALARRIEGWVELVFEVDAEGRVQPETIRVLAADPEGVFDRAARRAIARWRFATDELASGRTQLRQRLEFRLEGSG